MWDKKHFDWDCSHDNSRDNWRDYYDGEDDNADGYNSDDDDDDVDDDDSDDDDNGDEDENQDILGFIFCSVASNRLDKQWLGRSSTGQTYYALLYGQKKFDLITQYL